MGRTIPESSYEEDNTREQLWGGQYQRAVMRRTIPESSYEEDNTREQL